VLAIHLASVAVGAAGFVGLFGNLSASRVEIELPVEGGAYEQISRLDKLRIAMSALVTKHDDQRLQLVGIYDLASVCKLEPAKLFELQSSNSLAFASFADDDKLVVDPTKDLLRYCFTNATAQSVAAVSHAPNIWGVRPRSSAVKVEMPIR
jgi:hypothetical protein